MSFSLRKNILDCSSSESKTKSINQSIKQRKVNFSQIGQFMSEKYQQSNVQSDAYVCQKKVQIFALVTFVIGFAIYFNLRHLE